MARGLRLDVALGRAAPALDPRDRAFTHDLVYGVARLRGRLDHLIGLRVHKGLGRLDRPVLELLRLGAYQLLYMDGVPRYAAVSQTVEQVRAASGQGAAGLANAVLRGVVDAGVSLDLFPDFGTDPVGFLSTWGSHPRWMVDRWLARWTPEDVRALVDADNERPHVSLTPLETAADAAAEVLARAGISCESLGERIGCVRLAFGADPAAALATVCAVVQDPGAHLVTRYADVPEGMKVADVCAAPGGKALALSGRVIYTLAADRSEMRMRLIRENARRTQRAIGLVVADAMHPPFHAMDVVLVDAPCTGTGTLARHPDGRWRLAPASLSAMVEVQRRMLDATAASVRRGGLLVYSTCSLEREENEAQVDAFLERTPGFRLEATDAVPDEYLDDAGHLFVQSWKTGFDGAFAARMRRVA